MADLPEEEGEPEDPVTRVKGARKLTARQVTALREALLWRDEIARERDRAPFRVIADGPLIEAVARNPRRVEELRDIKGFPKGLAGERGKELIRRLRAVAQMSEEELVGYPQGVRRGSGRPPPELEALVDRLKAARNIAAEELGLPRGTLLANATLLSIARAGPGSLEDLLRVEGMRRWKADVVGERILDVLRAN